MEENMSGDETLSGDETSKKNTKHSHKEHVHKQYIEHKTHKNYKNYKVAAWTLGVVSLVLLILLLLSIFTGMFSSTGSGGGVSEEELKTRTIAYLGQILPGQTVSVDSITDKGNIYVMKLTVAGRPYDSYATKDGKLLFPSAIDMTKDPGIPAEAQTPAPTNVPKTDKPEVELFVMSHCPYGNQAEKGILPAVRTLGDKIDFKVRFVYYAMHPPVGEVEEQLRQYCIQKEQPDVYLKYLACFLNSTDGGSAAYSEYCRELTGVNETKMDSCYEAADKEFDVTKNLKDQSSWLSGRYPLFNIDKELNTKYGVGGSPTLVINGATVNSGRDSASYLAAICNAFIDKPEECNTQLSTVSPGPGFGYSTTAEATAAGCGV